MRNLDDVTIGDLDTLTLAELRQVQRRVNALAELIERWQQPNEQTVAVEPIPGGCLRLEWVKCGKCKKCADGGYPHGPYWYAYRSVKGRRSKTYIGRKKTG